MGDVLRADAPTFPDLPIRVGDAQVAEQRFSTVNESDIPGVEVRRFKPAEVVAREKDLGHEILELLRTTDVEGRETVLALLKRLNGGESI